MLDLTRFNCGMNREHSIRSGCPELPGCAAPRLRGSPRQRPRNRVLPVLRGKPEFPPRLGQNAGRQGVMRRPLRGPAYRARGCRSRPCMMTACCGLLLSATRLRGAPIPLPTNRARRGLAASMRQCFSARLSSPPVPKRNFFTQFLHFVLPSCKCAGSNSSMEVPFICDSALLRNRRIGARMSVSQLARAAGVDGTTISRIEEGQDPRLSTWNKINAALPQSLC